MRAQNEPSCANRADAAAARPSAGAARMKGKGRAPVTAPLVASKLCRRCKLEKPADEFHRSVNKSDGLQCYCKICQNSMIVTLRKRKAPGGAVPASHNQPRPNDAATGPAPEAPRQNGALQPAAEALPAALPAAAAVACPPSGSGNLRPAKRQTHEPTVATKECRRCGLRKEAKDFHRSLTKQDGLQSYCKPCQMSLIEQQRRTATANRALELAQEAALLAPSASGAELRPVPPEGKPATPGRKQCQLCQQDKPVEEFPADSGSCEEARCTSCQKCPRPAVVLPRSRRGRPATPAVTHKLCRHCGLAKPSSEFAPRATRSDGLELCCKACQLQQSGQTRSGSLVVDALPCSANLQDSTLQDATSPPASHLAEGAPPQLTLPPFRSLPADAALATSTDTPSRAADATPPASGAATPPMASDNRDTGSVLSASALPHLSEAMPQSLSFLGGGFDGASPSFGWAAPADESSWPALDVGTGSFWSQPAQGSLGNPPVFRSDPDAPSKFCCDCARRRPLDAFLPDATAADGLSRTCADCNAVNEILGDLPSPTIEAPRARACCHCRRALPESCFSVCYARADGLHPLCQPCQAAAAEARAVPKGPVALRILGHKMCHLCGLEKPSGQFPAEPEMADGLGTICDACCVSQLVDRHLAASAQPASTLALKLCGRCGKEKPQSEFYASMENLDGLQASCKVCQIHIIISMRRPSQGPAGDQALPLEPGMLGERADADPAEPSASNAAGEPQGALQGAAVQSPDLSGFEDFLASLLNESGLGLSFEGGSATGADTAAYPPQPPAPPQDAFTSDSAIVWIRDLEVQMQPGTEVAFEPGQADSAFAHTGEPLLQGACGDQALLWQPEAAGEGTAKLCAHCGSAKPATEFFRSLRSADGLQSQCKACSRDTMEQHRRGAISLPEGVAQPLPAADGVLDAMDGDAGTLSLPDAVPLKVCHRCGQPKPTAAFHADSKTADGLQVQCKQCYVETLQSNPGSTANLPKVSVKRCCRCSLEQAADRFHRDPRSMDGLQAMCKGCRSGPGKRKEPVVEPIVGSKMCRRCKQEKPTSEFHRSKSKSDGLQSYCKPCQLALIVRKSSTKATPAAAAAAAAAAGRKPSSVLS